MVRFNASWVIVTWAPPTPTPHLNRMTDTNENITFLQLRWRAVKIFQEISLMVNKRKLQCQVKLWISATLNMNTNSSFAKKFKTYCVSGQANNKKSLINCADFSCSTCGM